MNRLAKYRSRYLWLGLGAVVLIMIGAGLWWMNSNNSGQIIEADAQHTSHGPSVLTFDSDYIGFRYSSSYQAVRQTPTGTSLEMYMLTADTTYEKRLAEAVFPLDRTGLDGFTPYLTRKAQPNIYSRQDITVSGSPAVVFTKSDKTEITVFITRAGRVASLSFTSAGSLDDLPTEVTALLQTFSWKS